MSSTRIFLGHHSACRPHNSLIAYEDEEEEVFILLFLFASFLFLFASFFNILFPIMISVLVSVSISVPILVLCASPSDNLISLSYSMPPFSANLFGLFTNSLDVYVLEHF